MRLTRRIISSALNIALCVGKIGLGGYRSNEQQSMCTIVHVAISKRIEEVKRLQYAP
ncbi:hypothetical protein QT327_13245 [Olivibacter sp. 47]|uniref:hypothetical protein n=1 Tax=Olivibacter sp. 47 TaxID=3056486 RepID=UPI0025A3F5BB|nr:hypothetical protein [Olivibacter sp. 47]MDM8175301.1 hypothetical protein [Olivibacter sp. 47]